MKERKWFVIALLIVLTVLSACGSNQNKSTESNGSSNDGSEMNDSVAENDDTGNRTENITLSKPNPNATVDQLLGEWVDIDSPDRWVLISEKPNDMAYPYYFEDNEGKYKASFETGELKVVLSQAIDFNYMSVFFDEALGNMVYVYEGEVSKFSKK